MAANGCPDLWSQSRRIGETKGRIVASEDMRLRLMEMSDFAAADALALQIDALRRDLEYQQQVMVAMQARAAVRGFGTMSAARLGSLMSRPDRVSSGPWLDAMRPAPEAYREAV